ncbi:MAG: protein kinase [Synechococcaceae cyanobacterium SM2_3_1]|nr:protein kinase [Synechococcaceae cyanobacterium SM2_3_1]
MAWEANTKIQNGRYRIERLLGKGGFGLTYLAWANHKADRVVIKTLNETLLEEEVLAQKLQQDFLNEALRLARFNHPHIVRVEEVICEEGLWGIVMEYVEGPTLDKLIRSQGRLSESEALRMIHQVGDALDELHQQGLLHRDVKPANVLLRNPSQDAVLIDFGLVRDFSQGLIQHHTSWGTDGYAPIEQYDSLRKRGAWTDVYGLAATLYTMVTGVIPLCAPVRASGKELDQPRSIDPKVSEAVNQAILQGMALQFQDRPASISAWLEALPQPQQPSSPSAERSGEQWPSPIDPVKTAVLPPQAVAETETVITSLLPGTPSSQQLDSLYRHLQQFLHLGQWQAADQTTTHLMLYLCQRQREGSFGIEEIRHFPCQHLTLLDRAWRYYSQDRFGFSVQRDLWRRCSRDYQVMGEAVGWRVRGTWLQYDQLLYRAEAPKGHLPVGFLAGWSGGLEKSLCFLDRYLLTRLQDCLP